MDEGAHFSGIIMQGKFGDAMKSQPVRPPWYDVRERTVWDSWKSNEGKTIEQAQEEALVIMEDILKRNNLPYEDPIK